MNKYPNAAKESLTSIIRQMASSPALFVSNPDKDFTRKRKLPFETIMQLIISMGGNSIQAFDFLNMGVKGFYPLSFRVVRFRIPGGVYETVITNLSQSDFSSSQLKDIYRMRWGIETSFRELKYTIGLTNFHAKKRECILQEIFARIIMYNFAEMITSHVVISQTDTHHVYHVKFYRRFLCLPAFLPFME